ERGRILDDAVVDDRVATGRVAVGMGVAIARLAVRRPAGVGDALHALEALRPQGIELADAALLLGDVELALVADRDARRAGAAIFQAMQPFEQDGRGLPLADVADDSAHDDVLAVDDAAQLPPGVSRRNKTPAAQLLFEPREDRRVRQALA